MAGIGTDPDEVGDIPRIKVLIKLVKWHDVLHASRVVANAGEVLERVVLLNVELDWGAIDDGIGRSGEARIWHGLHVSFPAQTMSFKLINDSAIVEPVWRTCGPCNLSRSE